MVVNLVCGNGRELRVAAVEGSEEARAQLLGEVHPKALWDELLDERFVRCGAFFIPAGEAAWPADLTKHEPELPVSDDSGAWHPEDALLVPMRGSDAALLGIVSVDEPAWGRRPSDDELEILVAVVSHVTLAIEHAQAALHAQRRDAADEALAGMARELGACAGAEAVLDALEGRVRELCGPAGAGVARGPGAVVPAGALVLAVGPSARLWVAREEADEGSAQLLAPFAAQAALALTLLRRLGPASSVDLAA